MNDQRPGTTNKRIQATVRFPVVFSLLIGGVLGLFFFLALGPGSPQRTASASTGKMPLANGVEVPAPNAAPLPVSIPLPPGPFQQELDRRAQLRRCWDRVESGDSLSTVLNRMGIDTGTIHHIAEAAGQVMDLTQIRPGADFFVYSDADGNASRVEYQGPRGIPLVVIRTGNGWTATWLRANSVRTLSAASGIIQSSLWEAAKGQAGVPAEIVMQFTDIFRYDVDFLTDIRKGDSFRILYVQESRDGRTVSAGDILAAEFTNRGVTHEAYLHETPDGQTYYYDSEGRSLEKRFLKSPLQYRRISSFFSHSRMHPILKYARPHLGVDYAAPAGTPVETIGGGTVAFMGRQGGYGNLVIIDHDKNYTTMYAHLQGFAPGLAKGQKVKQGQLIGFVGATGLATGPHLDFRVKENGQFIDPLSVKLQPAPPIPDDQKQAFLSLVAERRSAMAERLTGDRVAEGH